MNERWRRGLRSALGVLLFGAALGILHHYLWQYRYEDVVAELRGLPGRRALAGLGLTCLSSVVLTGYDGLALVFIRPFSVSRSSFIMYGVEGRSWVAMGDPVGAPAEAHAGEGLSLGFCNPEYLKRLPLVVVRKQGCIVAFANLLKGVVTK
jgi:uncharacterized membrane protein